MLEKKELKETREFLCIVPIAVACVSDTVYNSKIVDSIYNKTLPNTKDRERRYRTYKKGEYASYVDPVSRVNFKIVGQEARRINEKEREILLKRVNELKDEDVEIPADIEIWELAASYEVSLKAEKEALKRSPDIRKIPLNPKKVNGVSASPNDVSLSIDERQALIAELKGYGKNPHPMTGIEKLKKMLEKEIEGAEKD